MFKALLKKQFKEIAMVYTSGGNRTDSKGKELKNNRRTVQKSAKTTSASNKKAVSVWFLLLYALVIFSMAMAFLGVSHALGDVLLGMAQDCEWLYFALIFVMAIAFGMIGSIFSVYSQIYKSKDNELLLSMPIKPWMIVCVRMLSCWVISLVCVATGFIPAMLKYLQYRNVSIGTVLIWIISIILCSFFCMALSCLLGWIVALVAGKLKNKSIVTVLITMVLLGGYYVFYFNANKLLSQLVANALTIGVSIKKNVFLLYAAGKAFCGDIGCFAILAAMSVFSFALVYWLISRSFIRITTASGGASVKKEYKLSAFEKKSVSKTLLKREFKHFLASPAYMLNCGIGVFFTIAVVTVMIIKKDDLHMALSGLEAVVPMLSSYLPLVLGLACSFLTGSNDLTAPSISIEGENFWILRSLPLDMNKVIDSKVKMQVYLNLIPMAAFVVTASLLFGLDALSVVLTAVFAAANVYLQALAGIAVNIKMPRFDWVNETSCVKQSGSVVIVLFGAWLLAAAEAAAYFFLLRKLMNPLVFTALLSVLTVIACILIKSWLKNKGSRILASL